MCIRDRILVIFIATLAGLPMPLTAVQLLLMNLLTDGAPALALGIEKGDPDTMDRPPRPVKEPIINREMLIGIIILSAAKAACTLAAFLIGLRTFPGNLAGAQTMAFATLSIAEVLRAYTARSEHYSLWAIGPFSNKYMQYAVLTSLAILFAVIYIPFLDPIFDTAFLGWAQWAEMLPLILIPSVLAEIIKWFFRQADKRRLAKLAETSDC